MTGTERETLTASLSDCGGENGIGAFLDAVRKDLASLIGYVP
jgi:hypothetical protein